MTWADGADSLVVAKAKYEGLAEWYEHEQARVAKRPDAPLGQFAELAEPAGGLIVEVRCGTGLAAAALRARGWHVGGIDLSMDQLTLARERCSWVVQADAHELPVRTAGLQTVGLAFVHTDVDAFDKVLREVARILQPGGRLVCLGIHPCFVGPHVDSPTKSNARLGVVPGYRQAGWVQSSEQFGPGIRNRVGVRHVTLADYLMAFVHAPLHVERAVEFGDGIVPWMLASPRAVLADDDLRLPHGLPARDAKKCGSALVGRAEALSFRHASFCARRHGAERRIWRGSNG
jgi:SAM-dependent methyltransferase